MKQMSKVIMVKFVVIIFAVMINIHVLEASTVSVSGGILDSFSGNPDYAWIVKSSPKWFRVGNGNTGTDTRADVLLDMGSIKKVNGLTFKNAPLYTGGQIRYVEVYAADETAPDFDQHDESKYNIWLYGNYVSGYTYDANATTTADIVNVQKRYLRIGIRDHANGYVLDSSHWYADLGDVNVVEAIVDCNAGVLRQFEGNLDDSWYVQTSPKWFRVGNGDTEADTSADVLLDMKSVKSVGKLFFKNAPVNTGDQIRYVEVYAANEKAPDFNPYDESKYNIWLYGNYVSDYTYDANAITTADILDVQKRYLRIKIIDHANGYVLNDAHWYANLGNISIEEPNKWISGQSSLQFFGLPDAYYPEFLDYAELDFTGEYPITFFYATGNELSDGDGSIDIVIDQGSVKDIQKVLFRNWNGGITNHNLRSASIWVTPAIGPGSESDPSFDIWNKAGFSEQVFPQTGGGASAFLPDVRTPITREADVTDVSRRYILMSIKSDFHGDIGTYSPDIPGIIRYCRGSDISVLGTDSISSCNDVVLLGLTLPADLNKDCHVNIKDAKILADEWLQCTNPGAQGCIQTSNGTPTYTISPVPSGGITVNGNLNDWPADSEWIYLTNLYSGASPYDVKEAKMSLRWDAATDKIYAAVIVDDPDHHFSDTTTYTADLIEVYSQGDAAGGTGWGAGASDSKYFDAAQQYFVGHKNSTGGWAAWADLTSINSNAGFESAVTLNGDKIIYEIGVKQFNNYGGISGGSTEVTNLAAGNIVGFDIIADTVFGGNQFSMISENPFTGKSDDAGQFQQYELVNALPQQYCGDWGYLTSDITQDCRVNLDDFAKIATKWMNCNDPTDSNCQHNW